MSLCKSLPEALKNPAACTVLKLTVKSPTLPSELFTLTNLTELYLDAPALKELPVEMGDLLKLKVLSIKAVAFNGSITDLFFLPCLENLKFIETPLEPLTITLAKKMAPLKSLTMKACLLKKLPLEFGELASLRELVLVENELSDLPFTFTGLLNLKRLNLDGNAFKTFPDLIGQMPQLLHLSIDGNKFSNSEKARIQGQFNITPN